MTTKLKTRAEILEGSVTPETPVTARTVLGIPDLGSRRFDNILFPKELIQFMLDMGYERFDCDGDRFHAFHKDGTLGIVMANRWDTEPDDSAGRDFIRRNIVGGWPNAYWDDPEFQRTLGIFSESTDPMELHYYVVAKQLMRCREHEESLIKNVGPRGETIMELLVRDVLLIHGYSEKDSTRIAGQQLGRRRKKPA